MASKKRARSGQPAAPPSSPKTPVKPECLGKCRVCNWAYFVNDPEHRMDSNVVCTCDKCLLTLKSKCVKCERVFEEDMDKYLLFCEICSFRGSTCFDCAGVTKVPEGQWFCSSDCLQMGQLRNVPQGFIRSDCTFTYADGKPKHQQFWRRCLDCDLNACMACAATCHDDHDLGPVTYASVSCDCGSNACCRPPAPPAVVPPAPPVVAAPPVAGLEAFKQFCERSIADFQAKLEEAEAAIRTAKWQIETYDSASKIKLALIPPATERADSTKKQMDMLRAELLQKGATCSTTELDVILKRMRPLEAELKTANEKLEALTVLHTKMMKELQEVHDNKAIQEQHAEQLRSRLKAATELRDKILASDPF